MKQKRPYQKCPFLLMLSVLACAQVQTYVPAPVEPQRHLAGLPSGLVQVAVADVRPTPDPRLANAVRENLERALRSSGSPSSFPCLLQADVVEHRSYFTLGNWNAATKLRVRLLSFDGQLLGQWAAQGEASRSNMWGYATAKRTSQDAYSAALADLLSQLAGVSVEPRDCSPALAPADAAA